MSNNDCNSAEERINFTIDGRPFSVFDPRQAPGDLLQLADLDPCRFDLARRRKRGKPQRFEDADRVKIREGDQFVSIRQSATVAHDG